jgi:hypothetical protein
MSRQNISLNTFSGPDSRDLSDRYPADRIRVSAWFCQNLSKVPACYLGITRGRVHPFYLPVLPLYGFTKLYTNPFLLIYLLPNFKLPVLVPIWGLEQKKTKFGFPQGRSGCPTGARWGAQRGRTGCPTGPDGCHVIGHVIFDCHVFGHVIFECHVTRLGWQGIILLPTLVSQR